MVTPHDAGLAVLELKGIGKEFGAIRALHGVDLRVSKQGDIVGEGALVARCPRAATVVATCPCRLLCWPAAQLEGVHIDRKEAKAHVISQALFQLPFFC